MGADITFSVFLVTCCAMSFFRVVDGSPQEHLWYQVNAVVDRALPTHTYTLQAHTFSENTLNITLKNPLPETVTLQVSKDNMFTIQCMLFFN